MDYIALELLLDKSENSVYKLVTLAAKRALEIAEGQPQLVKGDSGLKPSTLALQEIAVGRIRARSGKE